MHSLDDFPQTSAALGSTELDVAMGYSNQTISSGLEISSEFSPLHFSLCLKSPLGSNSL